MKHWRVDSLPGGQGPVVIIPVDDLIEHDEFSEDCLCGPSSEPVKRDDGSVGWVLTHHSLDGREADEPAGA